MVSNTNAVMYHQNDTGIFHFGRTQNRHTGSVELCIYFPSTHGHVGNLGRHEPANLLLLQCYNKRRHGLDFEEDLHF